MVFLQDLHHPKIDSYNSFCDREKNFDFVMVNCEGGDICTKIMNVAKGNYFTTKSNE